MELKINKEFAARHAFALAVFVVLGAWFGYDGFIRYPETQPAVLYREIEGIARETPLPETLTEAQLDSFKSQKIATQRILSAATLLAALAVGLHLCAIWTVKLSFDEDGFVAKGKKRSWSDIEAIDDSLWDKKTIFTISIAGEKMKLDGWHHDGVKEFRDKAKAANAPKEGV